MNIQSIGLMVCDEDLIPLCDFLCSKSLGKWGNPTQINVAIEELAELIHALTRFQRGLNIHPDVIVDKDVLAIQEELVDVVIMIRQLIIMFDLDCYLDDLLDSKLKRLDKRVNGGSGVKS